VRRRRNANANPDGNCNRYRYSNRDCDCDSNSNSNSNSNSDRHRVSKCDGYCYSVSDGERHGHGIAYGDTTTRNSSHANTASSADTKASSIAQVAASLPATPKLREGGCEA
jgi:hypothetical protein